MKKQEKEAMRRNQRKAKTIKPLERISEVIGAIRAELSKQRRGHWKPRETHIEGA